MCFRFYNDGGKNHGFKNIKIFLALKLDCHTITF